MSKLKPLLFTICIPLLFLAGCARQQQFKPVGQICMPHTAKTEAMQVAEQTLAKMHFVVEKYDAERGYMRTTPLSGAQFFEFWRRDNVGARNSAEANLQNIRRIAQLNITQQAQELCIACDVKVQRLSLPNPEVRRRSRVYEMFSQSRLSMQSLKLGRDQKEAMTWMDLGNNEELATEILKRIEKQLREPEKGKTK